MDHDQTEANINRNSKITIGLAIAAIVGAVGVTWRAFEVFEDMRNDISTLRAEVVDMRYQDTRRIENIEGEMDRRMADRWSGAMMEIWVLRSQQAGTLIDPAPILERHGD